MSGPTPWSLGGKAPDPAKFEPAKTKRPRKNAETPSSGDTEPDKGSGD